MCPVGDSAIGTFEIGVSPIEGSLAPPPPPAAAPPPAPASYDLIAALDVLMPGVIVQRNLIDAAWNAWSAKGFVPLVAADIPAILSAANALDLGTLTAAQYPVTEAPYTSLPSLPAGLIRLADSNPAPDGWAADTAGVR